MPEREPRSISRGGQEPVSGSTFQDTAVPPVRPISSSGVPFAGLEALFSASESGVEEATAPAGPQTGGRERDRGITTPPPDTVRQYRYHLERALRGARAQFEYWQTVSMLRSPEWRSMTKELMDLGAALAKIGEVDDVSEWYSKNLAKAEQIWRKSRNRQEAVRSIMREVVGPARAHYRRAMSTFWKGKPPEPSEFLSQGRKTRASLDEVVRKATRPRPAGPSEAVGFASPVGPEPEPYIVEPAEPSPHEVDPSKKTGMMASPEPEPLPADLDEPGASGTRPAAAPEPDLSDTIPLEPEPTGASGASRAGGDAMRRIEEAYRALEEAGLEVNADAKVARAREYLEELARGGADEARIAREAERMAVEAERRLGSPGVVRAKEAIEKAREAVAESGDELAEKVLSVEEELAEVGDGPALSASGSGASKADDVSLSVSEDAWQAMMEEVAEESSKQGGKALVLPEEAAPAKVVRPSVVQEESRRFFRLPSSVRRRLRTAGDLYRRIMESRLGTVLRVGGYVLLALDAIYFVYRFRKHAARMSEMYDPDTLMEYLKAGGFAIGLAAFDTAGGPTLLSFMDWAYGKVTGYRPSDLVEAPPDDATIAAMGSGIGHDVAMRYDEAQKQAYLEAVDLAVQIKRELGGYGEDPALWECAYGAIMAMHARFGDIDQRQVADALGRLSSMVRSGKMDCDSVRDAVDASFSEAVGVESLLERAGRLASRVATRPDVRQRLQAQMEKRRKMFRKMQSEREREIERRIEEMIDARCSYGRPHLVLSMARMAGMIPAATDEQYYRDVCKGGQQRANLVQALKKKARLDRFGALYFDSSS